MFAFVMAGLPTHAEVSECTKTHEGGCANYNKVVLAKFRENDFNISTCLTKCRTNTRCEGFALGKNRVRGKCILYKSDDQGNQCIKDSNKNWDYYSMTDCSAKRPTAEPTANAKPQPIKDCAEAEYQIGRLNEEIKRANSETKMIAQSYENDLTVSREVLEQVEAEKSTCERHLKSSYHDCQHTRDELVSLDHQLRNTQHFARELEQSKIEWKNKEAKLYSRKKKLEADVVTCKEEIDELYHQLMHTKMNRDKLVATVSSMRTKMSDLEDKLDGCQR